MKNLKKYIFLFVIVVSPALIKAQAIPIPSCFTPKMIESGGRQEKFSKDSIPFTIQFLDGKNIVWKEMKDMYYVMHHCSYAIKKNKVEINFLNGDRPCLHYDIEYTNDNTLVLKDDKQKIILERDHLK